MACLLTLIRYFGGDSRLERLREWSGTSREGTTLLGLHQAAQKAGLKVGAFEADLVHLKELGKPCILHILKENQLQHYIVCFGFKDGHFIIGDPGAGVKEIGTKELDRIWKSKALLTIQPDANFIKSDIIRKDKWQWIRQLVEKDLNILGMALAIGIVISILNLSTAIFSQKLIDDILPSEDKIRLFVGLGLLAFLLLSRNVLTFIRRRFLIDQSRDFNKRIIRYFYGKIVRLPQLFFDTRKTGDLIARMNDVAKLQRTISYIVGELLIHILIIISSTMLIMIYSVSTGLIALISLPVYFLLVCFYQKPILHSQRDVMAAHALNESNYIDSIQGISSIKTANKEVHFANLTSIVYGFFQDKIYHLNHIGIRFNFFAETTGVLLLLGILGWNSLLVFRNALQIGALVAIVQMAGQLIPSVRQLVLTNIRLQEARVAFERMYEFTSLEPEYSNPEKRETKKVKNISVQKLSVSHLSFRFPGRSSLLKDISFKVNRGEIIALLGESGCGKTTTLQILQRLYRPENGEVLINSDLGWDDFSTFEWRRHISAVHQEIKIFSGTVIDNISLGDDQQEPQKIIQFCREYGFAEYFEAFPQGYMTLLGDDGVHISGGQRQIVAMARALYQKPQLLLLDEATSSMDRNVEIRMLSLLRRLKSQMAIIMVTHRVQSAKYADHLYLIEEGRTTRSGTPQELSKGDNFFSRSLADVRIGV